MHQGNVYNSVTVVVPFYNRSLFFERLIRSLANQTRNPDEVIIVDNGSALTELELVLNVVNRYISLNIVVCSALVQGNANSARNTGFSLASSKYTAFLDSDDYWKSDHLEKCLDMASTVSKNNKSHLVSIFCATTVLYPGREAVMKSRSIEKGECPLRFLLGPNHGFAQSSGFFVSTQLREKIWWDESLARLQDIDFFVRMHWVLPWSFSSVPTVVVDWEDNKKKAIDFTGFKRFYSKHKELMDSVTRSRLLVFTLKECAVRKGGDEDERFIRQELLEVGLFPRLLSIVLNRKILLGIDLALSFTRATITKARRILSR